MEIRRLRRDDLDAAYALRLHALQHAPGAFLVTLAEERERGSDGFAEILERNDDDHVILGAFDGLELVGSVGVFRSDRTKIRHRALVWGMYVLPEKRHGGVGGLLVDRAIEHARTLGLESLHLSIENGNEHARRLYVSRGFEVWGVEPRAMLADGEYLDEAHMRLALS